MPTEKVYYCSSCQKGSQYTNINNKINDLSTCFSNDEFITSSFYQKSYALLKELRNFGDNDSEEGKWIKENNGKWWFKYPDGSYPKNAWLLDLNGKYYYFDNEGWWNNQESTTKPNGTIVYTNRKPNPDKFFTLEIKNLINELITHNFYDDIINTVNNNTNSNKQNEIIYGTYWTSLKDILDNINISNTKYWTKSCCDCDGACSSDGWFCAGCYGQCGCYGECGACMSGCQSTCQGSQGGGGGFCQNKQ